eukprot:CAMPEP_0202492284 /NCGR_PEP_ID=MMETSP1361-20130828/9058_1 /ASSEMBLY_ACC=CAM_ASM_000849 /TAXON_ID=210615 /ORGANISM="Staurosira complex sp., Strain CCMP2646" /LENGTH=334 /DNA_ID=CAMNT_0049122469 /DNA_START=239 /DNA_END=1243 /DNA_ORIENTATION=+
MPGPKMGPRPPDFDEALVRQSPTFQKWAGLPQGAKLKYACREFTKGHGQDEERLMRRIMIARRNNLKDHATLKKARAIIVDKISCNSNSTSSSQPSTKKRRTTPSSSGGALSDAQVTKEMDVVAVEATRSYRKWQTLQDGEEFLYNQKYTKGKDGHDWLLRKNIWRRMRYRRENKKMVQSIKGTAAAVNEEGEEDEVTAAGIVDHALLAANASATSAVEQAQLNATEAHDAAVVVQHDDHDDDDEDGFAVNKAVEAAVAAAEQYVKAESINMAAAGVSTTTVHNPLEGTTATDEALDAAARLAAASTTVESDDAVAKLAAEAVAGGDETDVVQI